MKAVPKNNRGVTLFELLLAIVILGVTLSGVMRLVTQLGMAKSALGEQSRQDGWHSFYDQAVLAGVDPSQAVFFHEWNAPLATVATSMPSVTPSTSSDSTGRVGDVEVTRLVVQYSGSSSSRPPGVGFEVGQSTTAPPPRLDPAPPLPPIGLAPPAIWPAPASLITLGDVVVNPGSPSTVPMRATALSGMRAGMQVSVPFVSQTTGDSVATTSVSMLDLAAGVTARAWTEFPGNPAVDAQVVLPDGRTRWFATDSNGQLQAYEPSDFTSYNFKLSIGRPVLNYLGTEYAAGGNQLPIDWYDRLAIETGAPLVASGLPSTAFVDWPATTKAHFGSNWPAPGLYWTTGLNSQLPGPSSGDVSSFFKTPAVPTWQFVSYIAATPVTPGQLVSDYYDIFIRSEYTYAWTFLLNPVPLAPPERTTAPTLTLASKDTFAADSGDVILSYGAPARTPTGKPYTLTNIRLGNPRANAGSWSYGTWAQSTGQDVNMTVTP